MQDLQLKLASGEAAQARGGFTFPRGPPLTSVQAGSYSGSDTFSDFESLSDVSSEVSEIPEAILEDSSDSDRVVAARSFRASDAGDEQRGAAAPLWVAGCVRGPSMMAHSGTAVTESSAVSTSSAPRTPVRRARVRGTVCLPTSARGELIDDEREQLHQRQQQWWRQQLRPTTAPANSRRADEGAATSRSLGTRSDGEHSPRRAALAESRARLELAERRTHMLEAELARQSQEQAEQEAVLQAVDQNRSEMVSLYREAHREILRLRSEITERVIEVGELRREQEYLKTRSMLRPTQNTCVVCLDAPAAVAPVPCGHLSLCEGCVSQLRRPQCPVCRRPAASMIQIFAC